MSLNHEPVWLITPPTTVSDGIREWLLEQKSLTQKMRSLSKRSFEVKVLQHDWGVARTTEKEHLGLMDLEKAVVRETRLLVDEQEYIFARSILPANILVNKGQELEHLGAKSLGEVLFRDPNLIAKKRWYAEFHADHIDYQKAVQNLSLLPKSIWGRRSLYLFHQQPLLVTELFLCA